MDPAGSHPLRGLIVEMATLLDSRGRIDRAGTLRLLNRIKEQADGLFLFGPEAGLGPDLETDQRAELLSVVSEECDLPLSVFITHPSRQAGAECAEILTKVNPNLVLVDAPLLARSNRDLLNWLDYLGQRFDQPLILYNHPRLVDRIPSPTKRGNIRTAILKRAAAEYPNLAGLIFRGEFKRLLNYHQAVRARTGFRIFDAQELRFLDRPSTSGVISVGANLIPAIWGKIVRAAFNRGPAAPLAEILACGRAARVLGGRLEKEPVKLILKLLESGDVPEFMEGLGLERWGLWPGSRPATGSQSESGS